MSYRNLKRNLFKRSSALLLIAAAIIVCQTTYAQTADGNNGINQANTMVRSYFDTGTQLMYAVGAILGLVGAVRVYQLWGSSHGEAGKAAAAWFGSCVFLVIVSTVLRSFFGL
jgi:hypothetical protein